MVKNRAVKHLQNFWHWYAFTILTAASLFFLFHPGIYTFTDSGYFYSNLAQTKHILFSKLGLYSNIDGFYFGYDNSPRAFSELLNILCQYLLTFSSGAVIGQILFYFLFFFLTFFFGLKLLKLLFGSTPGEKDWPVKVGALFLAFNPIPLLLIWLMSVGPVYPFFIIFFYAALRYFSLGKIRHLFLAMTAGVFLVAYLRLFPIVFILGMFILLLFWRRSFFHLRRWLILLTLIILCLLPFFVNNIYSMKNGSNIVSSYQAGYQKFERANYNFKSSFLFSLSNPGGFTSSAISFLYNNQGKPGPSNNFGVDGTFEPYKLIQIIFNVGLLIFALFYLKKEKSATDGKTRRQVLLVTFLLLSVAFLNTLGNFTSLGIFNKIHSTALIFLYNDYGFLQFISCFLYAFLVVWLGIMLVRDGKRAYLFSGAIILYLAINVFPLLSNFYALKKVAAIPPEYAAKFFDDSEERDRQATLFFPNYWLRFGWSPYYVSLNVLNDSQYEALIAPNFRVAGVDFVAFYNNIFNNLGSPNFSNVALFNVKNVFTFKDVVDANQNIDSFAVFNIKESAAKDLVLADKQASLNKLASNAQFDQYQLKDADKYDFFLYSPGSLEKIASQNFYEQALDLSRAPVVVTASSSLTSLDEQVAINYKQSLDNSEQYYVKIKNPGNLQSITLQFNQARSRGWKIYSGNQADWDKVACATWTEAAFTKNARCYYQGIPFNLADGRYLKKEPLPVESYEGNYFGGLYRVPLEGLPRDSEGNVYLEFYFQGQVYYDLALLSSLAAFLGVFVALIFQEISFLLVKKSRKFLTGERQAEELEAAD